MPIHRQSSQQDDNSGVASKQELREAFRSASARHRREPRRSHDIPVQSSTQVTCHLCHFSLHLPSDYLGQVNCPACGVKFEIKSDYRIDSIQIEQIEQELERIRTEIRGALPKRHSQREKSVIGPVPMQTIKKSFPAPNQTGVHDDANDDNRFYRMVDRVRSEMVRLEKDQIEDFLRWQASIRNRKAAGVTVARAADDSEQAFGYDGNHGVNPDTVPRDSDTQAVSENHTCHRFADKLHRDHRSNSRKRTRIAVAGIVLVLICCAIFPFIRRFQPGQTASEKPGMSANANRQIPQNSNFDSPNTRTVSLNMPNTPSTMQNGNRFGSIVFYTPNPPQNVAQNGTPNDAASSETVVSPRQAENMFADNLPQYDLLDHQLIEAQNQLDQARRHNEYLERVAKQNEAESLLWEACAHAGKDPVRSMILSLQAIERFEELGLEIPNNAKWVLNQSLVSQNLGISLNGFQGGVSAMTLSKDGQWFLFADDAGKVWLRDIAKHDQTGGSLPFDTINAGVSQLLMTSNTDWGIGVTRNGLIRLWNLKLEKPAEKPIDIADSRCRFTHVEVSDDGYWLAAYGQPQQGQGHEVFLWDLRQLTRQGAVPAPMLLKGHEKPIRSLTISRQSKWLVSGSEDRTVRVYDLQAAYPAAEQIVLKGHELAVYCVAVSPDGRWLVTGGRDSILRVWNLQTHQNMVAPIQFLEHEGWISALAFSPDGRYLASGSYDNTIRLWRMYDNEPPEVVHVLSGHIGPVKSVEFSQQGNQLVSLGLDREVRLWDIEQGNPSENVLAFRSSQVPFSSALLSGNGEWLILAQQKPNGPGQSGLRLWPMQFREAYKNATGFATSRFPELYQRRRDTMEQPTTYREERVALRDGRSVEVPHETRSIDVQYHPGNFIPEPSQYMNPQSIFR